MKDMELVRKELARQEAARKKMVCEEDPKKLVDEPPAQDGKKD
jgi:hypothetical protein